MLPSGIFRSRWAALLWAAGVVWTAYDVAVSHRGESAAANAAVAGPTDATGEAIDAADLAVLANAGG